MESIFNLVLDLQKPVSSIEVPVKVGESGRVLKIKIIDGKQDVNLPDDLQMTIGDVHFTDISLENPNFYIEDNYIIYHIAAPFIETVGSRILELNLLSENKSVRTMTFRLNVFKKIEAPIEEILPDVELSWLEQLIQMLQTFTEFGEIITKIEFNQNNQLIITSTTTTGEEHTYESDSLKGEQGIQGIQGEQGIPGRDGDSIVKIEKTATDGLVDTYTITLNTGVTYDFNVINGKIGNDGDSAYEIAVKNGYEGTEEQWLISLKGEKGDIGISIEKIEKTETSDLVDTYTITYSNGSTSTFTVKNGADGTPAIPPALIFDETSENSAAMSAIADYVAEQINDISIPSSAADIGAIDSSEKGTANGVAQLDANGRVPSTQLPSYVDDVIEGYYSNGNFYDADPDQTVNANLITGETGKIYVDLNTNRSYRWGGSTFIEVSPTEIPIASSQVLGGVKIGSNINVDVNGVISTHSPYVLPTASNQALGGVKVGNNLNMDQNGVLSADEQVSTTEKHTWNEKASVAVVGTDLVISSSQSTLEVITNAGY